jgi:hypothetical protein
MPEDLLRVRPTAGLFAARSYMQPDLLMHSSESTSDKLKWHIVLPLCFVQELFLRMGHLEHPSVNSLLALSDTL